MKLLVTFEGFGKDSGLSVIKGNNLKDCLLTVLDKHGYGWDEADPATKDDLINALNETNGNDCDYILSIITDKGKILFVCNDNNIIE